SASLRPSGKLCRQSTCGAGPITASSSRSSTATSRARGKASTMNWEYITKVRGFRTGENPARWRGHLDHVLPARSKVRRVKHHAALPYAELGAFIKNLRACEGAASAALEFLILTVGRTGEVIGARWPEIDFKSRVWTVPAERMKSRRDYV